MIVYLFISISLIGIAMILCKSLLNPLSIFGSVWVGCVLLYQLRLSGLQDSLSIKTYSILTAMVIAFAISFFIFYYFKIRDKQDDRPHRLISYGQLIGLLRLWTIVEIIEVFYSGGVPVIWSIVGSSKTYFDFGIPSVHGLMNALGLFIIAASTYLAINDTIHKKQYIQIIVLLIVFYTLLITRQVIISAIIEIIIILFMFYPKAMICRVIPIGFIGVLVFGLIGNFRSGYSNFLAVARIDGTLPSYLSGFYWVYMYLTMSFANINNLFSLTIAPLGLGAITTQFLPTIIADRLASAVPLPKMHLVSEAFTVSGYFVEFYYAYGFAGVVLIASIFGAVSGVIYKSVKKCFDMRSCILYAVLIQILLLSFFYNHLLYLPSGFQLIIALFLLRKLPKSATGRKV